jgi:Holliday junction resolvase-like predicted endonuclease
MKYNFRKYTYLNRMGEKGVQLVIDYLTEKGFKCIDVQKDNNKKGYDIIAQKDNKKSTIEVKTTQKDKGISDCYITEFNKKNKFIPDFLYVVRLEENFKLNRVEILTKDEVNEYEHKRIERIRVSSKLKTDLSKGKVGKVLDIKR